MGSKILMTGVVTAASAAALLLPLTAPASAGAVSTYQATATLDGRTTMSLSNHAYPDLFPVGSSLRAICQARGPVAYGSSIWDLVATPKDSPAEGRPVIVVDRYVRTGHRGFSPELRRCSSSDLATLKTPKRQPAASQEPAGLYPPVPDDAPGIRGYLSWGEVGSCDRNSAAATNEGVMAVDPNQHASAWQNVQVESSPTGGTTTTTQQQRGVSKAQVTSWCTNRARDGSLHPDHVLYRRFAPVEYSFRLRYFMLFSSENGRTGFPLGVGANRNWTVGDGLRPTS